MKIRVHSWTVTSAGPKTWFSHLAIECHPETNKNTWLEPVSDADYAAATKE